MSKLKDHYAILVAINCYPGIGNLNGPENDATEFKKWLVDDAGGNLVDDEAHVRVIRSSDFQPPATDPDDANPTETQFKKTLNAWLRPKGDWLGRVGERLYLYFAGHGFTAGSLTDPALFTAQAQLGDTVHIAALRYASKIRNAGFFDEILLVMDCCQDVLKASQVGEPTWSPPDRQRSGYVKLMEAYGAPRGRKAFESLESPVHGYFSSVLMEAIRAAPTDPEGFVTTRAVEHTFYDIWANRYQKLTGCEPPITSTRDIRLYRRGVPAHTAAPGPIVGGPDGGTGPVLPGPAGPVDTIIKSREPGAQIRVIDVSRREVASSVGRLQIRLKSGSYTARFRVGDEVHDHPFDVKAGDRQVQVEQGLLNFSSPIPLDETSTHHEYHYYPALELAASAAASAGVLESAGTLMVFARDSAHKEFSEWAMSKEVQGGLRLRRLDENSGEAHVVPCAPVVDSQRGYCSLLLRDLEPGTYLLGTRRLQGDFWLWQENALTIASSWWRTEVYLDSTDDDWTGRRFDVESASILIVPARESASLNVPDARLTEVARLALIEGRIGVDDYRHHIAQDVGSRAPMLALYIAYALTLSPYPDTESIQRLCRQLRESWTIRSADVKLLEIWCLAKDELALPVDIEFNPDEVPMIARGWSLVAQTGVKPRLSIPAQYYVGMWRTCGSLWTQTQVPDAITAPQFQGEKIGRVNPEHSPLQQVLRRAVLDAAEAGESISLHDLVKKTANESGLDPAVVHIALNGLRVSSSEVIDASWSELTDVSSSFGQLKPEFKTTAIPFDEAEF
jgi:hypothetical protein